MLCPDDNYFHPKTKNCTDCTPGYYGPNCVNPCRYPGYGPGCQKECSCNMTVCNHVNGCFEYDLDGHDGATINNHDLPMIIGLSLGFVIVLVIVVFVVFTVANRKFYTGHLRQNAHYVGSVVTEQSITSTLYGPADICTGHCSAGDSSESGIYMLASTIGYQNVRL